MVSFLFGISLFVSRGRAGAFPGLSKERGEQELSALLGLNEIIWLPGIKGKDITDGHTDFYARFAKPGVVVAGYESNPEYFDHAVTKKHLEILHSATDAQGQRLEVVVLDAPDDIRKEFATDDFAAGAGGYTVPPSTSGPTVST